tara:strand:+ start:123 stop:428 length:306 start_codon:yes stop_codon:yes gene_type:complete
MSNSDFNIQATASLARIKVDAKQEAEMRDSMEKVLGFVGQIREADVPAVEPKDFFRLTKNRLRPDTNPIATGEHTENIMRVAPDQKDGYFKIKTIIDKTEN